MEPLFSIIIPTYKRPEEVSALLSDLSEQTCKNFEVIVVDDTPDDSVWMVAKRFSFVRYYHPSERLGMVKSRNFGASIAKGKYLVFMDSDVRVPQQFVELLSKTVAECSVDGGVCEIFNRGRKHRYLGSLFDLIFPHYFRRFVPTERWGTCVFFRRDAFLSLGGFLEDLVGYTFMEDLEFVWRFVDAGYTFVDVDVPVEHLSSNEGTRPDELFYKIVNAYVIFRKHFPSPPLGERILFTWFSFGNVLRHLLWAALHDRQMFRHHLLSVRKILCWLRHGLPVKEAEINNILMRCGA